MHKIDRRFVLVSGTVTWAGLTLPAIGDAPASRKVFAHYMVCCPPTGPNSSVADFRKEIQFAQQSGIDGFALNCGAWSKDASYQSKSVKLFEAARSLDSGFELFFSADTSTGLSAQDAVNMMVQFHAHPSHFQINGRPLLSTFGGKKDWTDQVLQGCRSVGITPVFVPYVGYGRELNLTDIDYVVSQTDWADGYFYFGAAGTGDRIAPINLELSKRWLALGKLFMASVTPYYRGAGPNYRAFETNGFEAMAQEWQAAIQGNASFVEIVTWNDWGESTYVAPFGVQQDAPRWSTPWGPILSHRGYLEASRHFIEWYKTGREPAPRKDQLFYFYRLFPAHGPALPPDQESLRRKDMLQDMIFVTTILKASAALTISSGAGVKQFAAPAGIAHFRAPMAIGEQRFQLARGGKTILEKAGEFPVGMDIATNYNYFSGSAEA